MRSRLGKLVVLLLLVGLTASACGSDKKNNASKSTTPKQTTTTAEQITATLAGSGSTFQKPFLAALFSAFLKPLFKGRPFDARQVWHPTLLLDATNLGLELLFQLLRQLQHPVNYSE